MWGEKKRGGWGGGGGGVWGVGGGGGGGGWLCGGWENFSFDPWEKEKGCFLCEEPAASRLFYTNVHKKMYSYDEHHRPVLNQGSKTLTRRGVLFPYIKRGDGEERSGTDNKSGKGGVKSKSVEGGNWRGGFDVLRTPSEGQRRKEGGSRYRRDAGDRDPTM